MGSLGSSIPRHPIQMLVDIGDPILPNLILPAGSRKLIFQYTAKAIKRRCLAGLFFETHLPQQIGNTPFHGLSRVFKDVFNTIFVEIDPTLVINGSWLYLCG